MLCKGLQCERDTGNRSYCAGHQRQKERKGKLTPIVPSRAVGERGPDCTFAECDRPSKGRSGLCSAHYQQKFAGKKLTSLRTAAVKNIDGSCLFDSCERKATAKGYCVGHYAQQRLGKTLKPLQIQVRGGQWGIGADGYVSKRVWITADKRQTTIYQHRVVMEEYLGRKLLSEESVHHKNGFRSDNRIENLELWNKAQPAGQRVEDKLAWALQMIETYKSYVPAA